MWSKWTCINTQWANIVMMNSFGPWFYMIKKNSWVSSLNFKCCSSTVFLVHCKLCLLGPNGLYLKRVFKKDFIFQTACYIYNFVWTSCFRSPSKSFWSGTAEEIQFRVTKLSHFIGATTNLVAKTIVWGL